MVEDSPRLTELLRLWGQGDEGALDQLLPLVYGRLRVLARAHARGNDGTMRPTALVNEAYLRFRERGGSFDDRAHFFAAAALTMRRLLVDYARNRSRLKRGGAAIRVELDEELVGSGAPPPLVVALDEALQRLAEIDERKARIVELQAFGGLTYEETAAVVGLSSATVGRELRFAKAWLHNEMGK